MTTINLDIDFRTAAHVSRLSDVWSGIHLYSDQHAVLCRDPRNKSNQVSGITNLARNLGGSIGISMLSTFCSGSRKGTRFI